jgi:predicted  nucleic acid-binding Zn-ribbon protein
MLPDLERLIKLQHLESTIAEAKAQIAAHPERVAAVDALLQEAQQAVDAARQQLKDNHEARRAAEKDVALYQGRLGKFRDQQAAVKTNREYQALGHEIEVAQHDLANVEEKVIERMVEADSIDVAVKSADAALAARKKEVEAAKQELAGDLAHLQASLTQAAGSRDTIVAEIDPRVRALFEQVARIRKGIAVAQATRDGLCTACHVRLRPMVFQQVRANDHIHQCDSCQRILYYVPPPPPVEHPIVRT